MSDATRLMQYDANKKSAVVAYLLWLFFGMFGAHRFYLSQPGTGAALLIITLLSILLMALVAGFFTIWISIIWVLVDLFLIPRIVREYNLALAGRINMGTDVEHKQSNQRPCFRLTLLLGRRSLS